MKAFGIVVVILACVLGVMGVFGSITDIANRTLTFFSVAIESILSVVTAALIVIVVLGRSQDSRFGRLAASVVSFSMIANLILLIGFVTGSVEQGNPELAWFMPLVPAAVQGLFLIHYLRSEDTGADR